MLYWSFFFERTFEANLFSKHSQNIIKFNCTWKTVTAMRFEPSCSKSLCCDINFRSEDRRISTLSSSPIRQTENRSKERGRMTCPKPIGLKLCWHCNSNFLLKTKKDPTELAIRFSPETMKWPATNPRTSSRWRRGRTNLMSSRSERFTTVKLFLSPRRRRSPNLL